VSQENLSQEQNQLKDKYGLVHIAAHLVYFVYNTVAALMFRIDIRVRGAGAINQTVINDYVNHHEENFEDVNG
jgi:hypothetical protein